MSIPEKSAVTGKSKNVKDREDLSSSCLVRRRERKVRLKKNPTRNSYRQTHDLKQSK